MVLCDAALILLHIVGSFNLQDVNRRLDIRWASVSACGLQSVCSMSRVDYQLQKKFESITVHLIPQIAG
jgi:hypothetical protein